MDSRATYNWFFRALTYCGSTAGGKKHKTSIKVGIVKCPVHCRLPPALNSLVPINIPRWREALWEVSVLDNTVSLARARTGTARRIQSQAHKLWSHGASTIPATVDTISNERVKNKVLKSWHRARYHDLDRSSLGPDQWSVKNAMKLTLSYFISYTFYNTLTEFHECSNQLVVVLSNA